MIIVGGSVRIPENKVAELLPAAQTIIAATRKEAGCIVYSFAFDVVDKGLLRIYEEWESLAHLEAHLKQPHMLPWRAKLAEVGASDRKLKRFEADAGTPL